MGGRVESTENAGPEDAGPKVGWNVLKGGEKLSGRIVGGGCPGGISYTCI